MKRIEARIYGYVQGVGFRYFARRNALNLGLVGYARNLSDGSVEVVAEGEDKILETFLAILRKGSNYSSVDKVDYKKLDATGEFNEFYAF
jgi:acylphosphatase